MSPKEQAIQEAIATIEKALSETLKATMPKVMGELFDAGGNEYAIALQRAMRSVGPLGESPRSLVGSAGLPLNLAKTTGAQGKDGRAPRGSVRRAVLSVLLPNPEGLAASDIVARAQEIDPSISAGGIHNELNRQKGTIYVNEGGLWRVPPEMTLGGDYYDLNNLRIPKKSRPMENPE
ncbi:MAG: hypothetical protein Devi2KO_08280 [Devosia indica]